MKKLFLLSFILAALTSLSIAQSGTDKMLKDINGKVDEIVIKSEGKTYTFSGDEAEKLFSAMKDDKKIKSFSFTTKDGKIFNGDSLHKKIIVKKLNDESDSDDDVLVFIDEDDSQFDGNTKMVEKRVIVSENDGEKIVKITTTEEGKENIEVFEGKVAEEYLEKMKSDKEIEVNVDIKEENGKKVKKIIIEKELKSE